MHANARASHADGTSVLDSARFAVVKLPAFAARMRREHPIDYWLVVFWVVFLVLFFTLVLVRDVVVPGMERARADTL